MLPPFAPWITNPIGYSGSIFLTKPAGDPVVTIGSTPWRCACVEDKPARAITLTRAILNERRGRKFDGDVKGPRFFASDYFFSTLAAMGVTTRLARRRRAG